LQQTQVDRVIPTYTTFLTQFPTAADLAHAKTANVIRAWAGLGYNRRALFLQRTAQAVEGEHKKKFPNTLDALKELPGVGDYTARAILSFAFDQPVAVMDTNHRKFYSRLFQKDMSDRELLVLAQSLVDQVIATPLIGRIIYPRLPKKEHTKSMVYHWNQALMDFMTAVAKGHHHPTVQWFIVNYTELPKKKKKVTHTVPFRDTDRYYRGRIIDALRGIPKISKRTMRAKFPEISDERFGTVLLQLKQDGLIKFAKQSIVLP